MEREGDGGRGGRRPQGRLLLPLKLKEDFSVLCTNVLTKDIPQDAVLLCIFLRAVPKRVLSGSSDDVPGPLQPLSVNGSNDLVKPLLPSDLFCLMSRLHQTTWHTAALRAEEHVAIKYILWMVRAPHCSCSSSHLVGIERHGNIVSQERKGSTRECLRGF